MVKSRLKKLFAIILGISLTVNYAAPSFATETDSYEKTAYWYESIPEMLAAGEYEEGVVVAGIIPGKKNDIAADEVEEIMEVDAGIAEVTPEEEEVSISLIRRDGMTTEEILRELAKDSSVVFAEPNYIMTDQSAEENYISLEDINRISQNLGTKDQNDSHIDALMTAADPENTVIASDLTGLQWGNSRSTTYHLVEEDVSINVPDFGGEGSNMTGDPITVAVFDTPVDYTHPDLKDVVYTFTPEEQKILGCDEHGYNAAWDADDEKLTFFPGVNHGTHCAGIIASSWDGHGISGVASNVRLVSVQLAKTDTSTSLDCILRGLDFVRRANELTDADIRIISNSWGICQNSRSFDAAVRELGRDQGVIFIVSAGNDSLDLGQMNDSTSAVWDNPYVISVAATDPMGDLALYSSYGRNTVTLGAPGSSILSTVLADEGRYIPDAVENKYYNGFENDQGIKICQLDSEKRILENGAITSVCDDIGYSGTQVLRLGFNDEECYSNDGVFKLYGFSFELGDVSNLDVKAGDHVGFAVAASSDIAVVSAYCYDADGNAIPTDLGGGYLSEPDCWEIKGFTIPEGTDFSNFRFRFFLAFFAEATCDHVYFDSLGIGSECVAYDYKDGTSMACPAVSGAAAIIASRFPEARGTELITLVKSSVRSLPSLKGITQTGGIIDLSVDLTDPLEVAPVISSLNVRGKNVTITGKNFGSVPGNIILAKEKPNGKAEAIDAIVAGWTDNTVSLVIEDDFQGIMSAELTSVQSGKKDRITKLIRRDTGNFELEYHIGPGKAFDPFDFTSLSALETDGVMAVIGDTLYFMPEDRRVEEVPANRQLYFFDEEYRKNWLKLTDMPFFMEKVSSATTGDGLLYVKGIPMDDINGYAVGKTEKYAAVISYNPKNDQWTDQNADDVGLDDTLVSDGENIYLVGEKGIRRYDPESGAGETLFTFDNDELIPDNLKAAISQDNLYLFDGINYRAWVVSHIQTRPGMKELILPEVVYEDYQGRLDAVTLSVHGGALVAVHDGAMLIGPEAVDGSSNTFRIKNGSTEFESYDKRVSDGRIVAVSAVSGVVYGRSRGCMVERIFVIATSYMDEYKIIFKATDYTVLYSGVQQPVNPDSTDPDPVDPDPEPQTAVYSNEWVDGKWYDKDGSQTYTAVGSWKKDKNGSWYEDTKGWYPRNRWQKIDGKWYFFDKKGYMECNTYRSGWYLGSDGAWNEKGEAVGWTQDEKGWKYISFNGTALTNGWKMIDGSWYYFHSTGYAAQGEFIQGWWLNTKNCRWTYPYKADWHKNTRGWWYGDSSGWYAGDKWLKIDGTWYYFDQEGYMVLDAVHINTEG